MSQVYERYIDELQYLDALKMSIITVHSYSQALIDELAFSSWVAVTQVGLINQKIWQFDSQLFSPAPVCMCPWAKYLSQTGPVIQCVNDQLPQSLSTNNTAGAGPFTISCFYIFLRFCHSESEVQSDCQSACAVLFL